MPERESDERPPITRVLIVDDHRAFSDALGIAIDLQPDLAYVGTAGAVDEALDVIGDRSPDVVLMDVRLPGVDGIEGVRRIKAVRPEVRVLVLTGFADADAMARAALAGASGFFPKERPVGEILEAIRTAGRGGMVVEASVLAAVLARVREPERVPGGPPPLDLTDRQREVLALMAEGLDPRAIARTLGISLNTTRGHIKGVMAKLGAHSQLEAVVQAMHLGLLDAPAPGLGTDPRTAGPSSHGGA
ncbi:MAG TPA: response regulator transcription factor [Actinomycetota bacterium]|nr:response regulator transcription factor [Actinomycetota bacterium]